MIKIIIDEREAKSVVFTMDGNKDFSVIQHAPKQVIDKTAEIHIDTKGSAWSYVKYLDEKGIELLERQINTEYVVAIDVLYSDLTKQ